MKKRQHRTRERGFVMLYVLIASALIFILLGMAVQANHALNETNHQHAREVGRRAARLTVHLDRVQRP